MNARGFTTGQGPDTVPAPEPGWSPCCGVLTLSASVAAKCKAGRSWINAEEGIDLGTVAVRHEVVVDEDHVLAQHAKLQEGQTVEVTH